MRTKVVPPAKVASPNFRLSRCVALMTAALWNTPVSAADVSGYSIEDLLAPCVEADNDARWGAAAETECEQYIVGYTDAFAQLAEAAGEDVCLPELNRPDEVRWAFMKWAKQNYGRRGESAAEGLKIVLESAFICP